MLYIKPPNEEKAGASEAGDMNGTYEFEMKKQILKPVSRRVTISCGDFWSNCIHWDDITSYYNGGFQILTKWQPLIKPRIKA